MRIPKLMKDVEVLGQSIYDAFLIHHVSGSLDRDWGMLSFFTVK